MKGWEYRKLQAKAKQGWKPGIPCPYFKERGRPLLCLKNWTEQDFADHPERCAACKRNPPKYRPLAANVDGLKLAKRDPMFSKVHYQGRRVAPWRGPRRVR